MHKDAICLGCVHYLCIELIDQNGIVADEGIAFLLEEWHYRTQVYAGKEWGYEISIKIFAESSR